MTNPFAPQAPAQPAAPANPFATSPAPQQQAAPNPFGGAVAVQPQVAQAAPAPAAPPALDLNRLGNAPAPVVGEGRGAKLPDMYGRLLLFFPLSMARVPRSPQYITAEQRASGNVEQDRLTATVVVLDDGQGGVQPIGHGGAPYALPPTPHTESSPLPYVRKGMWINQSRLISQLRDALPQSGLPGGMIAGRLVKAGQAQNDPWYLIAATEAEINLVRQYLQLVQNGQYPHPLA